VPSALLGLGTILLIFFLARELSNQYWLPVWAMLVLISTHFFMQQAMRAMTDVPFTFFFTLAILGYVKGLKQQRYFILCGMAMAAAILTRSFLGAIPLGIILLHLLTIGRSHLLRSGCLICGFLLALGLPLVWFVSQYQLHGDVFLAHHFSFTFENIPETKNRGLFEFADGVFAYPLLLLKSYWPWLPLMLAGVWVQVKKMIFERDVAGSLLIIWLFCVIAPFSLAETKALRYILPAFPAFAMLAAMTLHSLIPAHRKTFSLRAAYGVTAIVILVLAVNPKYRVRPEEMRRLAPIAEAATRPDEPILLYTNRQPEWAHLQQVIWYAERRGHLLTKLSDLTARLEQGIGAAIIADKEVFTRSVLNLSQCFEVLGETENFICFRPIRAEMPVLAQQIKSLQVTESKEAESKE
jgi:4-amino-4-deoxy-L-arabinose transferase-like glycosyltransferase